MDLPKKIESSVLFIAFYFVQAIVQAQQGFLNFFTCKQPYLLYKK